MSVRQVNKIDKVVVEMWATDENGKKIKCLIELNDPNLKVSYHMMNKIEEVYDGAAMKRSFISHGQKFQLSVESFEPKVMDSL